MAATLRFETGNPSQALVKLLEREHQKILRDEQQAQGIKDVYKDVDANLKAAWSENLEESSMKQMYRKNLKRIESEVQHGQKSLVVVRRAALQELMEKENQEYESELHGKQKAFYIKRT